MSDAYIMKDGKPVPVSITKWAESYKQYARDRQVALDYVDILGNVLSEENTEHGVAFVSTVFLGLDHSFGDGPPVLWETLVFACQPQRLLGRTHDAISIDSSMRRYSSLEDALAGHQETVTILQEGLRQRGALLSDEGEHWPPLLETGEK